MKLDGSTVAITGAGSGIGRALAIQLAARRCRLALADVEAAALQETTAQLGGEVLAVVTDVSDASAVRAFADAAVDRFDGVDVVVNNAGVSTFNLLEDATTADWQWVIGVNLMGVVHGIDAFLPTLIGRERAHIVNVASIAGVLSGVAYLGAYAATKAAVVSITETLAQELAAIHPHVSATVLCPGSTDTALVEAERNRPGSSGREERSVEAEAWRAGIKDSFTGPIGRSADDVALQLIDGIEDDRLFVFTHPESAPMLEDRLTRVADAVASEARRVGQVDTTT